MVCYFRRGTLVRGKIDGGKRGSATGEGKKKRDSLLVENGGEQGSLEKTPEKDGQSRTSERVVVGGEITFAHAKRGELEIEINGKILAGEGLP